MNWLNRLFARTCYLLLLLIITIPNINAQTIIAGGQVTGSWIATNSPYIIQGDIEVPMNQSLSIESGVRVEFDGYYGLTIHGSLMALGSSADSIVFTSSDTTGLYTGDSLGRWKGLLITQTGANDSTALEYTKIKYTHSEINSNSIPSYNISDGVTFFGAITISHCNNVSILNSCITNNLGGITNSQQSYPTGVITAYNTNPRIANNLISNNPDHIGVFVNYCDNARVIENEIAYNNGANGAGIYFFTTPNSIIEGNYIHHNKSTSISTPGGGGGIFILRSNINTSIRNNIIVYNESEKNGAGVELVDCKGGSLTGNLIANNYTVSGNCGFTDGGSGLGINYCSKLLVQNNVIVNNTSSYQGGGVFLYRSRPEVIFANNTIANNRSNLWGGGIAMFQDSGICYNNIITGNFNGGVPQDVYFAATSDHSIWRSNLLSSTSSLNRGYVTSSFDSLNFVFGAPDFLMQSAGVGHVFSGSTGSWNLLPTSIAVNRGAGNSSILNLLPVDYGNNDRYNGIIDIGAYEYQVISNLAIINNPVLLSRAYPNPFVDRCTIVLEKQNVMDLDFRLVDLLGRVRSININKEGKNQITFNGNSLEQGIYFVQVLDQKKIIQNLSVVKK